MNKLSSDTVLFSFISFIFLSVAFFTFDGYVVIVVTFLYFLIAASLDLKFTITNIEFAEKREMNILFMSIYKKTHQNLFLTCVVQYVLIIMISLFFLSLSVFLDVSNSPGQEIFPLLSGIPFCLMGSMNMAYYKSNKRVMHNYSKQ